MVPAGSDRVSRAPPYSGYRPLIAGYAYGAITRYGPPFQVVPLPVESLVAALQPRRRLNATGLGSSPFARHYSGNHCCFILLRLLRCFSSAGLPPVARVPGLRRAGCPIRTPADQRPFAPPRGFSQLVTSFIASRSLGILRAPLLTSPARRPASARARASIRTVLSLRPVASRLGPILLHCLISRLPPRQRTHCYLWRISESNR